MSFRLSMSWLIFSCAMVACSSTPILSMLKLSRMDPLTADPQVIRVAIRTTDAIGLQKGDVRMQLGYVAQDKSLLIDDTYLVEVMRNDVQHKELVREIGSGEVVTILKLSLHDAQKLKQSQQLIQQHQSTGQKGEGSFGIGIHGSCLKKPLPPEALFVDIFIKTHSDEPYFLITENLNLYTQENIDNVKRWPVCG